MTYMPIFRPLKDVLMRPSLNERIATWDNFKEGKIAFDEDTVKSVIARLEDASKEGYSWVILCGAPNTGKTVTAKGVGFRLLDKWGCFYANAMEIDNTREAVREYQAYHKLEGENTLFIVDDCHLALETTGRLLSRLKELGSGNAVALVVSRRVPDIEKIKQDEPLITLKPSKEFRISIARKHMANLGTDDKYKNARYLPSSAQEIEEQGSDLIERLGTADLKVLRLYLEAWRPDRESLSHVRERTVLERLYRESTPRLDSPEAQSVLLPLCAICQFEIPVHTNFFDRSQLQYLEPLVNEGLVTLYQTSGYCTLPDPSVAPWYLKAASLSLKLTVDGALSDINSYVSSQVGKYGRIAGNPQALLRLLVWNDQTDLANDILQDRQFIEHLYRWVQAPSSCLYIAPLFRQLRKLQKVDLVQSLAKLLDKVTLGELSLSASAGSLAEHVSEFLELGEVGEELVDRLISLESMSPKVLGGRLKDSIEMGECTISELIHLVTELNKTRYNTRQLIWSVGPDKVRERFVDVPVDIYARLLQLVRKANLGMDLRYGLVPDMPLIVDKARRGNALVLRSLLHIVSMSQRHQLLGDLSEKDWEDVISRSTLNQLVNVLEDQFRAKSKEARAIGSSLSARLASLDLSEMIRQSNLQELGNFVYLAIELNSEVADKLLDNVLKVDLDKLMSQEPDAAHVIQRLQFLVEHFHKSPEVGATFTSVLLSLDLSQYLALACVAHVSWLVYSTTCANDDATNKWVGATPLELWHRKLTEAPPQECFWLSWNLFQANDRVAMELASNAQVSSRLPRDLPSCGLLSLCGVESQISLETSEARAAIQELIDGKRSTELALSLHALCQPSMRNLGVQVKRALGMDEVKAVLESAKVIPSSVNLFGAIFERFREVL